MYPVAHAEAGMIKMLPTSGTAMMREEGKRMRRMSLNHTLKPAFAGQKAAK